MTSSLHSRLLHYRDRLILRLRGWRKQAREIHEFWRSVNRQRLRIWREDLVLVLREAGEEWQRRITVVGEWKLRMILTRGFITCTVLFFLVLGTLNILLSIPAKQVAFHAPVEKIYYLDQNWGPSASSEDRQRYYHLPQGTSLLGIGLRYKWLVNLEGADGRRFIQPDHMRALGFLVDNVPTPQNPDRLPVGFTKHWDPVLQEDVLDLTCSLCHTGELHIQQDGRDYGIRIDGGQAMHAVTSTALGQFGPTLVAAMGATLFNPARFNRFARVVLRDSYSSRFALWRDVFKVFAAFMDNSYTSFKLNLAPVEEGFARTDAVGRIANQVFANELDPRNF